MEYSIHSFFQINRGFAWKAPWSKWYNFTIPSKATSTAAILIQVTERAGKATMWEMAYFIFIVMMQNLVPMREIVAS